MKKLIYVLTLILLATNSYSYSTFKSENNEKNDNYNFSPVRIKIDFSTRSKPENGECIGTRGICIIIGIERNDGGDAPEGFTGTGEIYLNADKKLVLNIIRDDAPEVEDQNTFNVYEDIVLNEEICEVLGVRECVIKKGTYKTFNSEYEFGSVLLNTSIR